MLTKSRAFKWDDVFDYSDGVATVGKLSLVRTWKNHLQLEP